MVSSVSPSQNSTGKLCNCTPNDSRGQLSECRFEEWLPWGKLKYSPVDSPGAVEQNFLRDFKRFTSKKKVTIRQIRNEDFANFIPLGLKDRFNLSFLSTGPSTSGEGNLVGQFLTAAAISVHEGGEGEVRPPLAMARGGGEGRDLRKRSQAGKLRRTQENLGRLEAPHYLVLDLILRHSSH